MSTVEELERKLEAMEARLRVVEDIEAIRRLKARYGQLADLRYGRDGRDGVKPREELEPIASELASLFSEDAVWDGGKALGLCEGRDAIYQRMLEPTLHFSWHYFVKPQIQVDGDRASGTWDILAACTTNKNVACWMSGLETDEYVRVEGLWLHSRMSLEVVFMAPYDKGWARRSATG